MLPRPNHPAAALGRHRFAISAALAAASAGSGFAAIAVGAYAGHPAQSLATATYALFGMLSGAACAAIQTAFDNRAAYQWPQRGTVAPARVPEPIPSAPQPAPEPLPAAPQPVRANEAAQPA